LRTAFVFSRAGGDADGRLVGVVFTACSGVLGVKSVRMSWMFASATGAFLFGMMRLQAQTREDIFLKAFVITWKKNIFKKKK